MKLRVLLPTLFAFLLPAALSAASAKNCGCACCKGKEVCCCHAEDASADAKAATAKPAPVLHPLTGVVTKVMADHDAVMVKHDEIPGVMRAMTMLFKVDAATLKAVKPGDAITALMTREEGEWRLYEVKVVAAAKK